MTIECGHKRRAAGNRIHPLLGPVPVGLPAALLGSPRTGASQLGQIITALAEIAASDLPTESPQRGAIMSKAEYRKLAAVAAAVMPIKEPVAVWHAEDYFSHVEALRRQGLRQDGNAIRQQA